jgi:hypothetical protein
LVRGFVRQRCRRHARLARLLVDLGASPTYLTMRVPHIILRHHSSLLILSRDARVAAKVLPIGSKVCPIRTKIRPVLTEVLLVGADIRTVARQVLVVSAKIGAVMPQILAVRSQVGAVMR